LNLVSQVGPKRLLQASCFMAGLHTIAGGGSLFLSVGSKNCCQSRTVQGTPYRLYCSVKGFEKPLGFFLQFFDGPLLDLLVLK
jgi:hypothetical protein